MSRTLLIIGAGREQITAYELARQKGYIVVGTDMDPAAPALAYADHTIIASTRDVDETLTAVAAFVKMIGPIDGVMTVANDVPYTVARVAEMLGVSGAPSTAVARLTHKYAMKNAFEAASVATPKYYLVTSCEAMQAHLEKIGFPAILKPSDGRGSRGVLLLDADVDLAWAFEHSMGYCDNGQLLLEEFVAGPQLSVEGIWVGEAYHVVAYADRNYNNLAETKPYIVEDGGVIPSRYEGQILEDIRSLIECGSRSLGLTWGTVKADIVLDAQGKPMIIELAGRLSGNYLATHHIPAAYGVDFVGAVIDLCMGEPLAEEALREKQKKYFGVRYFFPPAGKILSISGMEAARTHNYTYQFDMYIRPGDRQSVIDNHAARAGTVMCEGVTYEEALVRVENLVKSIDFTIEPL